MLFFRSEEHVNRWCQSHNLPRRPIINLDQLWQLSTTWYGNRLTVDSRRPGPEEVVSIFAAIGLEGPFWDPQADIF
jgi:hypothetical protein